MTNVFVQNLRFYPARFSIQSLFKTTPCPLKHQRVSHTGVLASDISHEYTVDRRSSRLTASFNEAIRKVETFAAKPIRNINFTEDKLRIKSGIAFDHAEKKNKSNICKLPNKEHSAQNTMKLKSRSSKQCYWHNRVFE